MRSGDERRVCVVVWCAVAEKRPLPKQRSVLYHRVVLSVCDAASLVNLRNHTDGLPSISCICCASSFARTPPSRRRACLSAERGPSQSAADGLQSRQRAAPCVCAGFGLAARQKRVLKSIARVPAILLEHVGQAPACSSSQAATAGRS